MKNYIITFSLLFIAFSAFAQQRFSVTGKVVDTDGPVPYANVYATDTISKKISGGSTTAEDGSFELSLKKGVYVLKIQYLGYAEWSQTINVSSNLQMGTITLKDEANELEEVVVKARKNLISRKGDKIVMNIKNNAFAKGKNVSEILKYAPNVWVDPNNSLISLKGLNATILINGKNSYMTAENLMNYLNSLSENELKSIEIISNPSARYDAEGLGGIINIIVDKKKEIGLRGGVTSRATVAKFFSSSQSVQLNSRISEKLSLNSFFFYQDNNSISNERRTETITSSQTTYNYQKVDDSDSQDLFANFDLQYDASENDQFVLQYRVLGNENSRRQINDLIITDTDVIDSDGIYGNSSEFDYYALGFNYNRKLDTLGQNLNVILDYYVSDNLDNADYLNLFFDNDVLVDQNTRRSNGESGFKIFSSQVDYTKPLENGQNLELGAKYSRVQNESSSVFENLINGNFEIDNNFTNAFNYDEQIFSVYASYNKTNLFNSKIDLQAGLRGEQTRGRGEITTTNFELEKDYFNLFPSVFLTKQLKNKKSVGVSYSRRINRPNYSRFNPTIFYLTDFTSQVGNPDLDPAYTNAFEINYNSTSLNIMLYYNDVNGEQREILTRLSDTELRYQWRNIDQTSIYGLSMSYNKKLNSWMTLFANTWWFGKEYRSSFADAVDNIDTAKGTFQGRLATSFKLSSKVNLETSVQYNGPETNGQFETGENYAFYLDASMKLSKNLNFYVNVVDPFNRLRFIFRNRQPAVQTSQVRNNFNQSIRFTLQYNFDLGGKTKNVRYRGSSQDEKNRSY